jgi:hypothetical protein
MKGPIGVTIPIISWQSVRVSMLLLLAVLLVANAGGKVDPETGRIRLLHIGDAFKQGNFAATFFFNDPRIEILPVPSEVAVIGTEETMRYYRLYLPRREEDLRTGYDVVCITGAFQYHLGKFKFWTRDSVIGEGMGFVMADDPASFGGTDWRGVNNNWCQTVLDVVMPVVCADDSQGWSQYYFRIDVAEPRHPLVAGVPWEEAMWVSHNRVFEKQGSRVVARTRSHPPGRPALAYMDVGEGRSLAIVHDWGGRAAYAFSTIGGAWEWAPHVFSSFIYYSAKTEIPDPAMDMLVRERFSNYDSRRLLFLSIVEFADMFNANTNNLLRDLGEIDARRREVNSLYIDMELQAAIDEIEVLNSELQEKVDEAMKVKDRALLWIYVIEWCSVTGTMILAGYVLFFLMIRRRLYRDVSHTRLRV